MKTSKKIISSILAVLMLVSAMVIGGVSADAATLKAPKSLKVVNGIHGFGITWKKVSGAKKYQLYKDGKFYKNVSSTSATVKTADFTLTGGTKYKYKVRAINGTKKGKFSSTFTIVRVNKTVIKTLSNTATGIKITWQKRPGSDTYTVERKTTGSYKKLGTTTKTSYADNTAVSGTKYTYRITCYNKATKAYSTVSNVSSITRLVPVTGLTAVKSNDSKSVKLSWAAAKGATSYVVYRQKITDSDFVKIATPTTTSYTDNDIISNPSAYRYYVKAAKGTTTSVKSAERFVQTYGYEPAYFDDEKNYHVPLKFAVGDTYEEGKALTDYFSYNGNFDVTITEGSDVVSIDDNVITAKKAGYAKVTIKVTEAVKNIVDTVIKDDLIKLHTNKDIVLEITVV